jgi:hypothetical protein
MEKIQYIGETLLPGHIGQIGVLLGFVGALLSMVAYWFATQRENTPEYASWRNIGRFSFLVHGVGILAVIGSMLYAMTHQLYEYQYVQGHVSEELPMKFPAQTPLGFTEVIEKDKQLFYAIMHVRYRAFLDKGVEMMRRTTELGEKTPESHAWLARAKAAKKDMEDALALEKAEFAKFPFTEAEVERAIAMMKEHLAKKASKK